MNPKKSKDFIKPTSEILDLPLELVDDAVSFYWLNVRKELSNLESPSITINELGIFKVKFNKLSKLKSKYQYYIDNVDTINIRNSKKELIKEAETKIQKFNILQKKMLDEFERRKEVSIKRREYVHNQNLEE